MQDVELEFSDADYQNLTTFSLFSRMVRPQLVAVSTWAKILVHTHVLLSHCTVALSLDSCIRLEIPAYVGGNSCCIVIRTCPGHGFIYLTFEQHRG